MIYKRAAARISAQLFFLFLCKWYNDKGTIKIISLMMPFKLCCPLDCTFLFIKFSSSVREPVLLNVVCLWVSLDWNHISDSRLILHPLSFVYLPHGFFFRFWILKPKVNWSLLLLIYDIFYLIYRNQCLMCALDRTFLFWNLFVLLCVHTVSSFSLNDSSYVSGGPYLSFLDYDVLITFLVESPSLLYISFVWFVEFIISNKKQKVKH